ncbi:MAG: LytTR family DNA-binding domain-containing protein [Schleiferiaceae bacterium]|jgi:DNA-binding LytR/AlgR family response regulator|nr:LytTR family DNA-binding domain-containing protein [Schleiferiaceae bacterium]
MKVVIIEDEPRAARRLASLIHELNSETEVVKQIESVKQGVSFFQTQPDIDLIFSDIQLTDNLSFEIFKTIEGNTPIIFTTAYNQYAIDAFKTNGIDYLLKPIDQNELAAAIEKYNRLQSKPEVDLSAIAQLIGQQKNEVENFKSRFLVKVGQHLRSVNVDDVSAFYSKEKSTFLVTKEGRSYTLDQSLDQINSTLNPKAFYKISRGYIVALSGLKDIVAYSNSRLKLDIMGLENELVIVARDRTKSFKEWLGE